MENTNNSTPCPNSDSNKKGVIVLGETGVGKSNFGNFLIKSQKFKISSSTNSETQQVSYGESSQIIVIDSPGTNDSSLDDEEIEEKHLIDIVKAFKQAKYLNTILILLNYQQPRLSRNLKIMIKLFCSVFKISFFIKHLGIVFTRCFDEDGRPNEEELKQKRNEWDKELKQIIKSTLINEELTDDKIQYFFVNLNPKKKLDKGTEEEMKRLKLWIISNDFMNTDIVEESKHPGYKEEEEEDEKEEKNIEGEYLITKIIKKKRKKLIYIDGTVKYDGDWQIVSTETRSEQIERFKELNSNIEQFKKENEDLINQLNDAKEKNNLEIEQLKLEYQARIEEARARAQIIASDNNKFQFCCAMGIVLSSLIKGIYKNNNN